LAQPRVGLLNIGEEDSKGSELTLAAHQLLRESSLNFRGNIESNRLLMGVVDVVVTDGFTGNLVLKQFEGFGLFLEGLCQSKSLSAEERRDLLHALKTLEKRFSYEAYGGALLLGISGVSIISHGRSSQRAIANAVLTAHRQILLDFPAKLQATLAS
jgi:glycerol-3-phosphate acyltransferase PlsX